MSAISNKSEPRDRVISVALASVSLVLGVLPLVLLVRAVMTQPMHRPNMASVIAVVLASVFIGISLTIFRAVRRGDVPRWRGGGWPTYLLLGLLLVFSAMIRAWAKLIESGMVTRLGVRPDVAGALVLLPVIAGVLVFVVSWQRASPPSSQSAKGGEPRFLFGALTVVFLLLIASSIWRDVWPLFTYRPTMAVVDSTTVVMRQGRRGSSTYIPRVYFTYSVDGVEHRGTRVTVEDSKGEKYWAEWLVKQYQRGATVTAYYDPEQPDRSFLRRSAEHFLGMLAICLGMIALLNWSRLKGAGGAYGKWQPARSHTSHVARYAVLLIMLGSIATGARSSLSVDGLSGASTIA